MGESKQKIDNSVIGSNIEQVSDADQANQIVEHVRAQNLQQIAEAKKPTIDLKQWKASGTLAIIFLAICFAVLIFAKLYIH